MCSASETDSSRPSGAITSFRTCMASSRLIVPMARAWKAKYHVPPSFAPASAFGSPAVAAALKLDRCGAHTKSSGSRRTTARTALAPLGARSPCASKTRCAMAEGAGNSGHSAFRGPARIATPRVTSLWNARRGRFGAPWPSSRISCSSASRSEAALALAVAAGSSDLGASPAAGVPPPPRACSASRRRCSASVVALRHCEGVSLETSQACSGSGALGAARFLEPPRPLPSPALPSPLPLPLPFRRRFRLSS
mmetsp:Transcript_72003/g.210928  ORF Transcript_72003/g.210928 Transcript_72003/m.210928 type:complete len:252 (+) Transcript_72003:478-1233(+)